MPMADDPGGAVGGHDHFLHDGSIVAPHADPQDTISVMMASIEATISARGIRVMHKTFRLTSLWATTTAITRRVKNSSGFTSYV